MLILVFALGWNCFAQELYTARLVVVYGGSIPFNFNSIQRYSEGIEIEDGTILGVTLQEDDDSDIELEGFDLQVRAFNAYSIKGDAYELALDRIRIRADNYMGLVDGEYFGYQELSSTWVTLFSYNPGIFEGTSWNTHQLGISFDCGRSADEGGAGIMLGENPDFYSVEVEFVIVPFGPGL